MFERSNRTENAKPLLGLFFKIRRAGPQSFQNPRTF